MYVGASGGLPSGGFIVGYSYGFTDFPATTDPRVYDLLFHNNYAGAYEAIGPHSMILMEIKR